MYAIMRPILIASQLDLSRDFHQTTHMTAPVLPTIVLRSILYTEYIHRIYIEYTVAIHRIYIYYTYTIHTDTEYSISRHLIVSLSLGKTN